MAKENRIVVFFLLYLKRKSVSLLLLLKWTKKKNCKWKELFIFLLKKQNKEGLNHRFVYIGNHFFVIFIIILNTLEISEYYYELSTVFFCLKIYTSDNYLRWEQKFFLNGFIIIQ